MKILILGEARHGKDTLAEILQKEFNITSESSSIKALDVFLFDLLNSKYDKKYSTKEEAFEDRISDENRAIWYNEICEYNKKDKCRLAKETLKTSDIYIGMRSIDELLECKKQKVFDLYLGIYNPRVLKEASTSNTIPLFKHSDIVLINNGTIEDLEQNVKLLNL